MPTQTKLEVALKSAARSILPILAAIVMYVDPMDLAKVDSWKALKALAMAGFIKFLLTLKTAKDVQIEPKEG